MASTFDRLTDAVRDRMQLPPEFWGVGENSRAKHGGVPRIEWVHAGGEIEPVPNAGRQRVAGAHAVFRPLHIDSMDVQAHIWAEDFEGFERLRQRLLSAVRDCLGAASTPGRYAISTESDRAGVVHGGKVKGVQSFVWKAVIAQSEDACTDEIGSMIPTRKLVTLTGSETVFEIDATLER